MDISKAYEVLGLPNGAGEEQVKEAYRALASTYNVENYEAGPLREQAEAKMQEINEAFDLLMSYLRTGTAPTSAGTPASSDASRYPQIRRQINAGQVDLALQQLSAAPNENDPEWNFLMGSVYYHKGWLDQALHYFSNAVRLAPGNREYEAALRNLQNSANGNMQGDLYVDPNPSGAALNCACNTCSLMCCMDACCGMGRGC